MSEESIKLEMRLNALEYMTARLYAMALFLSGLPEGQIEALSEDFIEQAGKQIFPVNDPALSDLASAEWQGAIARLVTLQKAFLADLRASRGR